ncbi:hypothetical protein MYRNA_26 [Mycobacterium phage Myrna]|uniref:Uncharacterized protein n=1 Tax=Mycobacterium phage Myrna TaxID=546805 RepID=B5LJ37_9CAUD|nr:gp26 [Mycobacterium phage Myrna]ACH62034.1 hypothetical protein MYRNA_26 [Mycobacterium phage Myrna]
MSTDETCRNCHARTAEPGGLCKDCASRKPRQQYRTPDGSIWEKSTEPFAFTFLRVDSPDGGHEDDFRAQKLDEVLESWGPLSLYDARQEKIDALAHAAIATKTVLGHVPSAMATLYAHLEADGWELTRKRDD